MRPNSFERGEYFWSPSRPSDARHVRRDDRGRVVTTATVASGRPKPTVGFTDPGASNSLARQVDAVTGSLRSWVLTGTRRIPIDPRRRSGEHEALRTLLADDESSVVTTSEEISESMKRQAVAEALNRLPDNECQVIKLAYFGGKTNDEIAASTGLPVSSVRRRLRDGLRQMQAHLESTGVVDVARGAAARRGLASLVGWIVARLYSPGRQRRSGAGVPLVQSDGLSLAQAALAPAAAATLIAGIAASAFIAAESHPTRASVHPVARVSGRVAQVHAGAVPGRGASTVQAVVASTGASGSNAAAGAATPAAGASAPRRDIGLGIPEVPLLGGTDQPFGATSPIAITPSGQIVPAATSATAPITAVVTSGLQTTKSTVSKITRNPGSLLPSPPPIP